jgi:CBS domain containing-hemolysin-like protein
MGMGWAGEAAISQSLSGFIVGLVGPGGQVAARAISFVLSFLFLTLVLVVFGEVVPKNLAIERSEQIAMLAAPVMLVFYRVAEPFVRVVERSAQLVSRVIGLRADAGGSGHTAEEIKHIVTVSAEHGQMRAFERDAIARLLDLHTLVAREVMVPRGAVVSLPATAELDDVLRTMSEQNYSRVPVYKDRPENIVGMVHYRDLLRVWRERRFASDRRRTARPFHLEDWIRKAIVVPETKPLDELIDAFRAGHTHLAIVVDEFGTVSGIVTMEDVLEQVFGEIEDEHDARRQPHRPEARSIEVDGTIPIRDLETQYGIVLPFDAGFETLAGFLLSQLGFIPKGGEQVTANRRCYTVLAMERNRISQVRIELLDGENGTGESAPEAGPVPA